MQQAAAVVTTPLLASTLQNMPSTMLVFAPLQPK